MKRLILVFAVLLAIASVLDASPVPEKSSDKKDKSEASVVSRLDPALRKALLQALSKYDDEASAEDEDDETTDTTTDNYESTTSELPATTDSETPKEAALNDQISSVQYHSFVVDSNNVTQTENDSEIIRTIIVKASDKILSDNKIDTDGDQDESVDDNKLESKLDPTKVEAFIGADNVHQVARSVATSIKSNEIDTQDDAKKTTTLPKIKFVSTTTTTTTTTTEAPTHNEDGENIEHVSGDDVSIYQAPLVTAFTIRQDLNGQSERLIPLVGQKNVNTLTSFVPSQSLPVFDVPAALSSTMQPPILGAQQFRSNQLQKPILEQQQFDQQNVYLRDQESSFRNQQEFLHEQRFRIEEEFRAKQQQYEQELRTYRQQQAQIDARNNIILKHQQFVQQQQFVQAPPLVQQQHQFAPQHQVFVQQLPSTQSQNFFQPPAEQQQNFFQQPLRQTAQPQSTHATSIQLIPSILVGTSFPISTQQLLPSKDSTDFHRSQPNIQFQSQTQHHHQLPTAQELPQRAFQPFNQQPFNLNPVDTQSRNRVFRQEIGTGNFDFNQANEQQHSNNQLLRSLIQNSGLNRHQTEDLNIISKVLALNHGIPDANGFVAGDSARLF